MQIKLRPILEISILTLYCRAAKKLHLILANETHEQLTSREPKILWTLS